MPEHDQQYREADKTRYGHPPAQPVALLVFRKCDTEQMRTLTQGVKMSPGDYEKELEAARSRGYALSREELIAGAVAIAAPFFNGGGKAAGSIGVFGPSVRMNKQRIDPLGASF